MHLQALTLKNFRCFESIDPFSNFSFKPAIRDFSRCNRVQVVVSLLRKVQCNGKLVP